MSANDWTYNIREVTETGDQPNSTRTTENQEPQPGFADSSGPLFHMYREMAEEQDNKMTERWQKDAEGIIIFTGLFSAAVAALVAVTVGDLKPNSQDTSAFYIEKIYQLQVLADSNISLPSILSNPAQPSPFSPPKYAILVNSLWFLSLVISLTCAMMATLLQQWARRYLRITQPSQCSPHRRARTRAFFAHGVDKFHLSWMVEALPALIHLSLFLFFIGLLIYLFNVNYTVFRAVVWWVAVSAATYLITTVLPIFRLESPYYTPLHFSRCCGVWRR
ncbi:hypothetical protein BJV78DRAFT_559246 [Lactifluus subvellereus]|nr:hypothetical protein BJV78DRAFT_559246 [Lactifluus subvellereus]